MQRKPLDVLYLNGDLDSREQLEFYLDRSDRSFVGFANLASFERFLDELVKERVSPKIFVTDFNFPRSADGGIAHAGEAISMLRNRSELVQPQIVFYSSDDVKAEALANSFPGSRSYCSGVTFAKDLASKLVRMLEVKA